MRNTDFTLKNLFECPNAYSLVTAIVLLGMSFVVGHFANVYAFTYLIRPTSVPVGDLLLDNLPIVDLNFIIIECALAVLLFGTLFIVIFRPRYILFSVKTLALFIAIRALFISLTHLGIYPGSIDPGVGLLDGVYAYFNLQTGFFFSGHTGLPFLTALVFWKERIVRNLFLAISFIFGIAVLFAHVHYSIDVLAAPFMAYGIFRIATHFFQRDYELIKV